MMVLEMAGEDGKAAKGVICSGHPRFRHTA